MLSELDKTLHLPDFLRPELQKVHGTLLHDEEIPDFISGKFVICVGDVVTYTLLGMGLEPNVAIVDYKTKRSMVSFEEIRQFGDEIYEVSNPSGCITPELWSKVREAIEVAGKSSARVRIDVSGEEDLAVLPAVLFAPEGGIVIYGMPNTGLVAITVNDEHRLNALRIINQMEV